MPARTGQGGRHPLASGPGAAGHRSPRRPRRSAALMIRSLGLLSYLQRQEESKHSSSDQGSSGCGPNRPPVGDRAGARRRSLILARLGFMSKEPRHLRSPGESWRRSWLIAISSSWSASSTGSPTAGPAVGRDPDVPLAAAGLPIPRPDGMLRRNAIEKRQTMLKTGWRRCPPPVRWEATASRRRSS